MPSKSTRAPATLISITEPVTPSIPRSKCTPRSLKFDQDSHKKLSNPHSYAKFPGSTQPPHHCNSRQRFTRPDEGQPSWMTSTSQRTSYSDPAAEPLVEIHQTISGCRLVHPYNTRPTVIHEAYIVQAAYLVPLGQVRIAKHLCRDIRLPCECGEVTSCRQTVHIKQGPSRITLVEQIPTREETLGPLQQS